MHSNPSRLKLRNSRIRSIFRSADIVLVQETHATRASHRAFETDILREEALCYWNDYHRDSRGAAILLKKTFAEKFDSIKHVGIDTGHVHGIIMRGKQGSLDIFNCYLDPVSAERRVRQLQLLTSKVRDSSNTLTVVGGDFNFIASAGDRINRVTLEASKQDDSDCQEAWRGVVQAASLVEFPQSDFTHRSGICYSRLDRVYASSHPSDDALYDIAVGVLPWSGGSAHLPVRASRAKRDAQTIRTPQVSGRGLDHPGFPQIVTAEFLKEAAALPPEASALERLARAKEVMKRVASELAAHTPPVSLSLQTKLTISANAYKACLNGDETGLQRALSVYPDLLEFGDSSRLLHCTAARGDLKAHLSKLQERMARNEIEAMEEEDAPQEVKIRKIDSIWKRLKGQM